MSLFTIVLAGKPNVGKSTLFNLLAKKRIAIVEDTPGVTVDYKETTTTFFDIKLNIIDTGGLTSNSKKDKEQEINKTLAKEINNQAIAAIAKANVVLLIVDGKEGLSELDKEVANNLRKLHKNIILVINKVDSKQSQLNIPEAKSLGFKHVAEISAAHKLGLHSLYNEIKPFYKAYSKEISNNNLLPQEQEEAPFVSIAIVGKPNVGKSTLINSLLQEKRLAVSDIPGTTKDSIAVYFNYNNKLIRVLDTAGLARKNKIKQKLDILAKNETIRSIIFAQVVILVIDANEGLTKQDLTLASYVIKEGRALIIAINKIDLIAKPENLKNEITTTLNNSFSEVKRISIIGISALKALNLKQIFKESLKIYDKWSITIKTSLLNKWLREIIISNPPPLHNGRAVKIKFISQEKTRPPTINLWVNLIDGVPKSYLSFLRNKIYYVFSLWGVPIRFNIKTTKNPYIKN